MLVSDQGNHRILRFRAGEADSELIAGGNGQGGGSSRLLEACGGSDFVDRASSSSLAETMVEAV